MKTPDNIQCFTASCAALLGELHGAFPRPVDIQAVDFQEELVEARRLAEGCAWVDEGRGSCLVAATLDYLLAEGVVRCGDGPFPPIYPGCVLTARGFTVLQCPAELTGAARGETIGEVLRRAGACTGQAVIAQAVALVFKAAGAYMQIQG